MAPVKPPAGTGGDDPPFSFDTGSMLCMGCRPTGRCRFGIELARATDGRGVVGSAWLGPEHEGAGGVAHGGSILGVLDEVCGAVPIAAGVLGVTAEMTTKFLRPVPLEHRVLLQAWPTERNEGGHWFIEADIRLDGHDRPLSRANAHFVERNPSHHYGRFRAWLEGERTPTPRTCTTAQPPD